jgi:hypothetical protein
MPYYVYRATDGRAEWPIITQYELPSAPEIRSVDVELLALCRTFLVAWEVAHAFIPMPGSPTREGPARDRTPLPAALETDEGARRRPRRARME